MLRCEPLGRLASATLLAGPEVKGNSIINVLMVLVDKKEADIVFYL